jgi:tetratricopeptide (TPR) repeat protein
VPGHLEYDMGRIEQLMQFVEANPGDPFPRYGLAMELKNTGRLDEAERAFSELLNRFPDYTPAYLHSGNVLRELGRAEECAKVYRAGIDACVRKRDGHAQGELEAALASLGQSSEGQ